MKPENWECKTINLKIGVDNECCKKERSTIGYKIK
jgi:hypothetical protein